MTATKTTAERIYEVDLQDAVVEAARLLGWLAVHWRPAMTRKGWRTPVKYDGKGFFDVTFVHPKEGRMLFVEFKSDGGKLSDEQDRWFTSMQEVVARNPLVEAHIWSPDQWPHEVLAVLGKR